MILCLRRISIFRSFSDIEAQYEEAACEAMALRCFLVIFTIRRAESALPAAESSGEVVFSAESLTAALRPWLAVEGRSLFFFLG